MARSTGKPSSVSSAPPMGGAGLKEEPTERRRLSDGYITRADLYAEAKRRGIEGRSKMTKAELRDLLNRRA